MPRKPWMRSARRILICAIFSTATTLAGCANVPALPSWKAEPLELQAVRPVPDCEWPEISEGKVDGEFVYYMSGEGFLLQAACQTTAQANHDIAAENAAALEALRDAYGELAEQGAAQRELAEYYLEDLEERRRATSVELWTYKGLLAIVGAAAIL